MSVLGRGYSIQVPKTQHVTENWLQQVIKGTHFDGSRGTSFLLWGGVPDAQGSWDGVQDRPVTLGPLAM